MNELAKNSVLLVGSIPLENREAVFDCIAMNLGSTITRIPDGETGRRSNWIAWQRDVFANAEGLLRIDGPEREYQLGAPFRIDGNHSASDIVLGIPGFAAEALRSYEVFHAKRSAGAFHPSARLQVSIPTPFAPVYSFLAYESQGALYHTYESAVLNEVSEICETIPPRDLAIQWDVATEMSIFEGLHPVPFLGNEPDSWLVNKLAQLGDAILEGVELGYHLCYGSMNNKHWKEPEDLGMCVWVANTVTTALDRTPDWFHMPVPIDRDDDSYFKPLSNLDLPAKTQLFLGLIHEGDQEHGVSRRKAAALRYINRPFGLATECGLGRYDIDTVPGIIELHGRLAEPDL